MQSSTMVVCHSGQGWIGHGALYVHQLYIILLVDCLLHRYGATHTQSHAAANYCYIWFYVLFLIVAPVSYFQWLQFRHHRGLIGVCIATVTEPGEHSMKCPLFSSIRIESHWAGAFVTWWLAVVEKVRKMITKSGKSWGVYSKLQVTREWMTVNLHVLLKINRAAHSSKLRVIPTVPRFAVSWSSAV